ncbi:hypothetical protein BDZ91DRAFT_498518 [Kalaharituber pfeilii]|nr:hypothetical protein BDZ91DRAFT_498518 [Kalaharituber pfeilii]
MMHAFDFHKGEKQIRSLLRCPPTENPTVPYLRPNAAEFLFTKASLLALGTLDTQGRPWTSIVSGKPGFILGLNQNTIAFSTAAGNGDPIFETLAESVNGEPLISGLAMDLSARRRWKLAGKVTMRKVDSLDDGKVQVLMHVEQAMGNCPKYITIRELSPLPNLPPPSAITKTTYLSPSAVSLITSCDLFFISSHSTASNDMDTNLRGGSRGFVRVLLPEAHCEPTSLVWPDYSGNRLYQTLGNLAINPHAGLTFPDFTTGNIVYLTGHTEILTGEEASKIIPRTSVLIKFVVEEAHFVENSLLMREPNPATGYSPYNPPVRYLASEKPSSIYSPVAESYVKLASSTAITPTITLYSFDLPPTISTESWKDGQHVVLDFRLELSAGYRHMNDEDPKSINDDYIRTWTLVSRPLNIEGQANSGSKTRKLYLLVRLIKNGTVTPFLARTLSHKSQRLEVPLRGVGGEFFVTPSAAPNRCINFIAAGVGITPILGQVEPLLAFFKERIVLNLLWSVNIADVDLPLWVLHSYPQLFHGLSGGVKLRLFITGSGSKEEESTFSRLQNAVSAHAMGSHIERRRIQKEDVASAERENLGEVEGEVRNGREKWYLCTGDAMRKQLLSWLHDDEALEREVFWEDFSY